jgi:hypothetical protein
MKILGGDLGRQELGDLTHVDVATANGVISVRVSGIGEESRRSSRGL